MSIGWGTNCVTLNTSGSTEFSLNAGQTITLSVKVTFTSLMQQLPSGVPTFGQSLYYDRQACEYSTAIPEYVCRYSTNGMMLHNETGSGESAVRKFFGFNNTATNNGNEVMLARCGEYGMSLMEKGLMLCRFSGNNVYRYRMNPLVMVVNFTYGSSSYSATNGLVYNPLNLSTPTAQRTGTGNVTITHNIGRDGLAFDVIGFGGKCWGYVENVVSNTKVQIFLINGSSNTDCNFQLRIFDYSSY